MRNVKWLFALFMLIITSIRVCFADNTATITVNVTIVNSPCVINNNQPIDVDFGNDVAVTDVATGLVEKRINYELDCSSMDIEKSLEMTISGTGADFDTEVLKTSILNLGVKIKANGNSFPLNSAFDFATAETKPTLTALLVQKPGSRLDVGAFTAGATMTVVYQ